MNVPPASLTVCFLVFAFSISDSYFVHNLKSRRLSRRIVTAQSHQDALGKSGYNYNIQLKMKDVTAARKTNAHGTEIAFHKELCTVTKKAKNWNTKFLIK